MQIIQIRSMQGKYLIGVRRQDKSVWQRRAPLTPTHIQEILAQHPNISFIVQPSKKRIFSDHQYEKAGAILDEDLSQCTLILGIKEVPVEKLIPDKTFLYFSHTIKAQLQNMPALDAILKQNIRLIDYEKICDGDGNRLIAFGKYAGMAGAIDFLKGLGEYIMQMGISTPFLHCNCSYKYFDVADCYAHLKAIGQKIREKEIPKELSPMIFAVTGRGRTAQGCLEVLENLPITHIKKAQFDKIIETKDDPIHRRTIYVMSVNTEDCIQPRDEQAKFDKQDFYKNPEKYRCNFKEKYLPYISALFHCIYWAPNFPKYVKNKHLYSLANTENLRLLGICDVTCDLDGSIECLTEYTQPEKPFFYYNSLEDRSTFDASYAPGKIMYLAIDFLPCELAYDASCHFSVLLKDWIENIAKSDKKKPLKQQGLLPEIQRAVIACEGKLMPSFEYIARLKEENLKKSLATRKKEHLDMEFDKTNSVMFNNVAVIENIQGEALDFTK